MNHTIRKTAIIAVIALSSLAITIPLVSAQVVPGEWREFRHDGERMGYNDDTADVINAVDAALHWWVHVPGGYGFWGNENLDPDDWWTLVPQVIHSSPVIGQQKVNDNLRDVVYFGTEETFLFDESEPWDNPDDYEYVNIGKVYAYIAEPTAGLDIVIPVWEFQVGSDIAEFDPDNPFASRVYSTALVKNLTIPDHDPAPKDYLFVTCGFETDPIPPDGDDEITERIFTGAVYCIDPEFRTWNAQIGRWELDTALAIVWRFEDLQTNDDGIEVPHFTGTNFSSPVIWDRAAPDYPILYTATADGRIFGINCWTGERAAGWEWDKWDPDQTGIETFTLPSAVWGSLTLVAKTDIEAWLYIGTAGGKFYKIDAVDPSQPEDTDDWDAIQWPESTEDPAVVGPIYSTAAYYESTTGEKLVFTCWDGSVYCLNGDLEPQWTFHGTYKWPPDIPDDEQLDIIPRFDSSPAVMKGVDLTNAPINPNKPPGTYDVVYVVSEEGYIYGLDLNETAGHIYADHDTYPGDTHELLYKAWNGGGAWSSPAVGFFGVPPAEPIPYIWVGTRAGQVRAYRADTFGRQVLPDEPSVATFTYSGGGGQFNSSPALTNEECYIGNQDGILYVFGLGGLLYGLDEPYEDSGQVTPSPAVVDPKVFIVTQSDYTNYNYVDHNTGPSTYAWGDTVYVLATGMDGGHIPEWNSDNPTRVTFRFTGEGVRSLTQRAAVPKGTTMARARWTLDPWTTRRRPTLVPGARFYVSCTQQSVTETAWANFGDQTPGQDPDDPYDVAWALNLLNIALDDNQSFQFLLIQNGNESPEFTITNPLKLYDHTGAASGDSILINGSSGQGMLVDLGDVPHNSESGDIEFAISDISHVANLGSGKDWINKLRAKADVMYWFGGSGSVVNPLDQTNSDYIREIAPPLRYPWDLDAVVVQPSNMSIDYPDLIVDPHKSSLLVEGQNTLLANTTLRRMDSPGGGSWTEYPTPAAVKIRVPRFQPANWGQGAGDPGYQALVTVWVDVDGDGTPDIPGEGDAHSMGRYEAYRQFIVGLNVPVDRKLDFATGQLDIGSEPHGYQSWLAARAPAAPVFAKDYTLKNSGNVNLYDVRLLLRDPWSAGIWDWLADSLFCDGVDWRSFVPVVDAFDQTRRQILSTINGDDPTQPPNATVGGIDSYSLHKPRVGDTGGAEMTVPDIRPGEGGGGFVQELRPQLTIKAPLGTPFGAYASQVYGVDYGGEWIGGSLYNPDPAVSLSPMEVVLSVRETKLTGPPYGFSGGSAMPDVWDNRYQIDVQSSETGAVDATAAAYRVPLGPLENDMRLIFSSNRTGDGSPVEDEPYFLYTATLPWDDNVGNWVIPGDGDPWWNSVTGFPATALIPGLFDELGGTVDTARFSAPAVAGLDGNVYLAFKGDGYTGSGGVLRASKVFLAPLQANGVPDLSNDTLYYEVPDAKLGKDTPRPLAFYPRSEGTGRFFLFWSQESAGKWEIYYTARLGLFSGLEADWQVPKKLELPRGMMSGRDPMPIFRQLLDPARPYYDNPATWLPHIDVFYSGTQRHKGDPDIYWSRYEIVETTMPAWGVKLEPAAFPPVVLEPMERIQKSGEAVFVSFGVDWDMDYGASGRDETEVLFLEDGDPDRRHYLVGGTSGNHGHNRLARDTATGAYVFKQGAYTAVLDPGAGLVRITTSDPRSRAVGGSPLPMGHEPVYISYRPRGFRVTRDDAADAHPVAFVDQILEEPTGTDPDWTHLHAPTRLWVLWRRSSVESPGGAMFYKTYRLGVDTGRDLYLDERTGSQYIDDFTGIHLPYNLYNLADPTRLWSPLWFVDWARGRHWFPLFEEGNEGLRVRVYEKSPGGPVQFYDIDGAPRWIEERGDTLAQMEVATNQANLAAFLDPIRIRRAYDPNTGDGWHWLPSVTRVWAFWTGSVGYRTDLYYEALVPRFESGDAPELYVVPPDRYH